MLLCCITLSSLRENQCSAQEVARRISGAVAGEVFAQVKTYQVPITKSSPSHYIICHLPLVFLSPTSPLPFYSPSFSVRLFLLTFFVCSLLLCYLLPSCLKLGRLSLKRIILIMGETLMLLIILMKNLLFYTLKSFGSVVVILLEKKLFKISLLAPVLCPP